MKRLAIAGALAATATLFVATPAQADPSLCLDVEIDVNGQGGAQSICLPPEDGGTPTLPGLPF